MSSYLDKEGYLSDSFDSVKYANSLVIATNNLKDTDIDLETPRKKLGYDLDEVKAQMNNLLADDYEGFIKQSVSTAEAKEALAPIQESLKQVRSAYNRLESSFLIPYEQAHLKHTALRKLNLTTNLLRALSWYLNLAVQLQSSIQAGLDSHENIISSTAALTEINRHLHQNVSLQSLSIVRSHARAITEAENQLKTTSLAIVKYYGDGTRPNDTPNKLSAACMSLSSIDRVALVSTVRSYLKSNIANTSNQLVKALKSANMGEFESACNFASKRANNLKTFQSCLDSESWELLVSKTDTTNLSSSYWRDVASNLDARVREINRNPQLSRVLANDSQRLKQLVKAAVGSDGPEALVMMAPFSHLR